jgi:hypothetical protein
MGTPAVSVFAGDAATVSVEDLVDMGPIPHASICISTVARLRAAGFVIRRTGRYPHCSVELGARPSIAAATRLTTAFDGSVPNPRTRSQRRASRSRSTSTVEMRRDSCLHPCDALRHCLRSGRSSAPSTSRITAAWRVSSRSDQRRSGRPSPRPSSHGSTRILRVELEGPEGCPAANASEAPDSTVGSSTRPRPDLRWQINITCIIGSVIGDAGGASPAWGYRPRSAGVTIPMERSAPRASRPSTVRSGTSRSCARATYSAS